MKNPLKALRAYIDKIRARKKSWEEEAEEKNRAFFIDGHADLLFATLHRHGFTPIREIKTYSPGYHTKTVFLLGPDKGLYAATIDPAGNLRIYRP